jgi:hypothetical protein
MRRKPPARPRVRLNRGTNSVRWCFRTFPEGTVLEDSSHGSAYPSAVLDDAHRDLSNRHLRPLSYRGCTSLRPRRGVVCTRPVWSARLAGIGVGHRRGRTAQPAIVLELEERAWAGVPCWSGRAERWASFTVPIAYDLRYDTRVRPVLGANQVSRTAVLAVAAARAAYAEYHTGRGSRPSNERLAADTGYSVRTVQRADTALRLLGVATEILRGRQRTRTERLASWRVGDRGRGWASVWALHDDAQLARHLGTRQLLSPHPEGSSFSYPPSRREMVTTGANSRPAGGGRGARRRECPDEGGCRLAIRWRADSHAPPWARRHTPAAWAALLAGPARHGWTARDLNQLVRDWIGVKGSLPDHPHKPIGLLGAMLTWHGADNLADRPAAADDAREAEQLAAHRAHLAAQATERADAQRARASARAALGGPGHTAAREAAAAVAARALARRTHSVAVDTARHDAAVRTARGLPLQCTCPALS